MEVADVASAERIADLVPPADYLANHRAATAGARDRSLRRQLVKADVVAGCASGVLTALLAGVALAELPVVALAIALGWPLVAGACGLYTVSPLRTWASGVGEAPRLGRHLPADLVAGVRAAQRRSAPRGPCWARSPPRR